MASVPSEIEQLQKQFQILHWDLTLCRNKVAELEKNQDEMQRKIAESETKHKKAEEKLEEAERNLAEMRGKLSETEERFAKSTKKQDKKNKEIIEKVELNTDEIGQAKRLKAIFKASLIGLSLRHIDEGHIKKIEDKITSLDNDISDLKAKATHYSKHFERMHLYNSSRCQEILVDQFEGLLTKRGDHREAFGTIISAQPLDQNSPFFSVEITREGTRNTIIGLAYKDWNNFEKLHRPGAWDLYSGMAKHAMDTRGELGSDRGTLGYVCHDGRIVVSGDTEHQSDGAKAHVGDVIELVVNVKSLSVEFFRNKRLICSRPLNAKHFKVTTLHPVVQLFGEGTAVKLLETDPWRA